MSGCGIALLVFIWAILNITSGDSTEGWMAIGIMVFSFVSSFLVLKWWSNDEEENEKLKKLRDIREREKLKMLKEMEKLNENK